MTTLEKVSAIIAEAKDLDAQDITAESTFEDLGLDSLDTVDLIMNFEDEFGVTLEMSEDLKTVGDVVEPVSYTHLVFGVPSFPILLSGSPPAGKAGTSQTGPPG